MAIDIKPKSFLIHINKYEYIQKNPTLGRSSGDSDNFYQMVFYKTLFPSCTQ